MGRFDRYMLAQLMAIFGFAAVILVLIYWINRAVRLFDWLIASGQSATVFLEFTVLTLPNVIRIVLPIAAFVATVYTTNRMTSESELVVVQSTGFGPFRLARPVLLFGGIVALFVAVLVHLAVPASFARLAERQVEIAENVTAQLLVEGQFVHPAEGMTLYIRDITAAGQLADIYIDDRRRSERPITYTATRASLLRTDTGPRLIMFDGIAQRLDAADRTLSVTRFAELGLDVAALIPGGETTRGRRSLREATTPELLRADEDSARQFRARPDRMRLEVHQRVAQSLLSVAAPLLGFSVLILGGFSRFGIWNRVFVAIGLVVLLWLADNAGADAGRDLGWAAVYAPAFGGIALASGILWLAAGPPRLRAAFRRRFA